MSWVCLTCAAEGSWGLSRGGGPWLEFSKSMSRTCELSRAVEEDEGGVEELAWKLTVELVDWKLEQR